VIEHFGPAKPSGRYVLEQVVQILAAVAVSVCNLDLMHPKSEIGNPVCGSYSHQRLKEKIFVPINNPKELFVLLLSDVRQATERTTKIFQEMSQAAHHPDIKEALEARVFVSDKILKSLDECFKLIGEKPMKLNGHLNDVFVEDFRRELGEIQSPEAKLLFILVKATHLVHLRIGEYVALIAAADVTGHFGVGVLLESCLADTLSFVERTRRLIRELHRERVAA
jgi:ferritin-like metal-binding protein YciE